MSPGGAYVTIEAAASSAVVVPCGYNRMQLWSSIIAAGKVSVSLQVEGVTAVIAESVTGGQLIPATYLMIPRRLPGSLIKAEVDNQTPAPIVVFVAYE